ncbi:WXG100 family type VII secretion target [Mycolicibacter minnesotensis]|uniref:WXG100 family type VII secretion target n=1 Tax=Mycolicibacter minnesotensis TaxID=1118379 RepID=A0A7I7R2U3_9MYCO|nr:WXG100 family type VII secretion target [Mycolicibacter minnesotensis]ORA99731.1 WXG100 family type VII secretion target [Mycolicibacter minnesotensis]BBY32905.1 ESAT-6-like protein EsxU [Mycolicibacter minnesotensis]
MSTPAGTTTLHADFDVMHTVAAAIDTGNAEIRGMLQGFVGRIRAVPPSVWSGLAAVRFHDILDRWNTEALNLHHALAGIAETIRGNERVLRDVAEAHSQRIAAAGGGV